MDYELKNANKINPADRYAPADFFVTSKGGLLLIMRICFLPKILFFTLMAITLFLSPCHADSGDRAIKIICDAKMDYFEVQPFVMWNEELDMFLKENPSGTKKKGDLLTHVFETTNRTYKYSCKTNKREIAFAIDGQDNLLVYESGVLITKKLIDDVWIFSGPVYIVKSEKTDKWVECCGHEETSVACKKISDSKTTNCKYGN
jgi:hypothetical protein